MRSLPATALGLSIASLADARVPHRQRQGGLSWFRQLFRKDIEQRQDACYPDQYSNLVTNSSDGEAFCQQFMNYPTQTVYLDSTPVATVSTVGSTTTVNVIADEFVTPTTTVYVTASPEPANSKRALGGVGRDALFSRFRNRIAAAGNGTTDDAVLSASFSSACACQTYGGPSVTSTFIHPTTTTTIQGFAPVRVTTTVTRIAAEVTITETVAPSALSSDSSAAAVSPSTVDSSSSAPTPTAPAFACPQDDNTVVSQMVKNARYDYLIRCGSEIQDQTIYGALYYDSFEQCAAACSSADATFDGPVCQGVSYFNAVNVDGYNCFMKSSANVKAPSIGVNSALLQRIALGLSDANQSGTTTESIGSTTIAGTDDPASVSSAISSALGDSTTSMPLITPGPTVVPGSTHYSTEIIDGTTFSTGSGFSSYYTSGGVWYYTWASSWSLSWSSAQIVYQSVDSSSQTGVSSTNVTTTTEQLGPNGETWEIVDTNYTTYYPSGGSETTEYRTTYTLDSAGSTVGSIATTEYFTASGGSGGILSGVISGTGSPATTTAPSISLSTSYFAVTSVYNATAGGVSTSVFSSQSVYTITLGGNGTGNGGGAASGSIPTATIAPQTSATTISTALSTGGIISGVISSTGVGASATPSVVTTIVNGTTLGFSTGGASSGVLSIPPFSDTGVPRGPGSESTSAATGTAPILTGITPSVLSSYYESQGASSGIVPTGAIPSGPGPFNSSVSAPSGTAPSGTAPFSDTATPRLPGTEESIFIPPFPTSLPGYSPPGFPITTSSPPLVTAPSGTAPAGNGSFSANVTSSGYPPFGNSGLPRGPGEGDSTTGGASGITSGTIPTLPPNATGNLPPGGTGPSGTTPPNPSGPYPLPSGNTTTAPVGTGTVSSGFPPFGNTGLPRDSGSASSTAAFNTAPTAGVTDTSSRNATVPFPTGGTAPASSAVCVPSTVFLGTTTILSTTTFYGCAETCTPIASQPYGYAPPLSFGPPVAEETST